MLKKEIERIIDSNFIISKRYKLMLLKLSKVKKWYSGNMLYSDQEIVINTLISCDEDSEMFNTILKSDDMVQCCLDLCDHSYKKLTADDWHDIRLGKLAYKLWCERIKEFHSVQEAYDILKKNYSVDFEEDNEQGELIQFDMDTEFVHLTINYHKGKVIIGYAFAYDMGNTEVYRLC